MKSLATDCFIYMQLLSRNSEASDIFTQNEIKEQKSVFDFITESFLVYLLFDDTGEFSDAFFQAKNKRWKISRVNLSDHVERMLEMT